MSSGTGTADMAGATRGGASQLAEIQAPVRELLDRALEAERRELFPDPSDDARMREMELDTLPNDTARAVQALKPYDWRSD